MSKSITPTNVLSRHFNYALEQRSPDCEDLVRKKRVDESGNDLFVYVPVDYKAIQKANGDSENWSLRNLLQAGINPQFSIHTGFGTRLEAASQLQEFASAAEAALAADAAAAEVEPKE